jgi:hypothetical protein
MLPVLLKFALPARTGPAVLAAIPTMKRPASKKRNALLERYPFTQIMSTSFLTHEQHALLTSFAQDMAGFAQSEGIDLVPLHDCFLPRYGV